MDRGVIATASELFEARHYPSVIAMCSDALEDEPECLPLLLIRARAHVALRRDLDAQADLRDVIRLDPACSLAYRLLGELAARRDDHVPAATWFREALRLDPGDRSAQDWLQIVTSSRPAAAVPQLPAPTAAAGQLDPTGGAAPHPTGQAGSVHRDAEPSRRLARGTEPPAQLDDGERVTQPFLRAGRVRVVRAQPLPSLTAEGSPRPTLIGRPVLRRPEPPARPDPGAATPTPTPTAMRTRPAPRSFARTPRPELPGFGEYLVANGILTRDRLRAAQAYQRSMKVQLSTAIVTLGLASPQRIEWAEVAHQAELAHARVTP